MTFNLLDCFDENIENLDITKNYIYVLQLIEDRYYVGRTSNILRRVEEHFTMGGSIYTKKYKPIKVIEVQEELTSDDERIKTLEIMEKYGWEKVRGACWCSLEIIKPDFEKSKKQKTKKIKTLISHKNDEMIRYLYCIENKNIIEIGENLKMSPSLIYYRLEKLCVIRRRQLARGYFEYIESDLYREAIDRRNKEREQKKNTKRDMIEYKFDTIENDNNIKFDFKNIKKLIRDKYVNLK
jgi:predicted GIY-YIG superfamily endonuclease